MLVAKDKHNALSLRAQLFQAVTYKTDPDAALLPARRNSHGSQGNGRHRALRGFDRHACEQDVANDLAIEFSHQ